MQHAYMDEMGGYSAAMMMGMLASAHSENNKLQDQLRLEKRNYLAELKKKDCEIEEVKKERQQVEERLREEIETRAGEERERLQMLWEEKQKGWVDEMLRLREELEAEKKEKAVLSGQKELAEAASASIKKALGRGCVV